MSHSRAIALLVVLALLDHATCTPCVNVPGWFTDLSRAADVSHTYFTGAQLGMTALQWTCNQNHSQADPITQQIYQLPDQIAIWAREGPSSSGGTVVYAAAGGLGVAQTANASFSSSSCGLFSCSTESTAYVEALSASATQQRVTGLGYEVANGYRIEMFSHQYYPGLFQLTSEVQNVTHSCRITSVYIYTSIQQELEALRMVAEAGDTGWL